MTLHDDYVRALVLSATNDLVVSYTAAGWRISFPDDDSVLTIPLADHDDFSGPRITQPHGTHAAFNRHRKRGDKPCRQCRDGERAYQAERHNQRRRRLIQNDLAPVYHLPTTFREATG